MSSGAAGGCGDRWREFPAGSTQAISEELGKLSGRKATQFPADLLRHGAVAILQDAAEVIAREEIDALLGFGTVVQPGKPTTTRLRAAIEKVLRNFRCLEITRRLQQ